MTPETVGRIADKIMLACAVVDILVAALYLYAKQPWKGLYWFAAGLIVLAVTRMFG